MRVLKVVEICALQLVYIIEGLVEVNAENDAPVFCTVFCNSLMTFAFVL